MSQFQRVKSLAGNLTSSESRQVEKLLGRNDSAIRSLYTKIRNEPNVTKIGILGNNFTNKDRLRLNELISRLDWILLEFISDWDVISKANYPVRTRSNFILMKSTLHFDILQYRGLRNDSMELLCSIQRQLEKIESFDLLFYVLRRKHRYISQYGTRSEIQKSGDYIKKVGDIIQWTTLFEGYRNKLFDASVKDVMHEKLVKELRVAVGVAKNRKDLNQYITFKRHVAFFSGVVKFYAQDFSGSFSEFLSAYRANNNRQDVYLMSYHTLTLINMSISLMNLGKLFSARLLLDRFMEVAKFTQDRAAGMIVLLKIKWRNGDWTIDPTTARLINEYVVDRNTDSATRRKLEVLVSIFQVFANQLTVTHNYPWRRWDCSCLRQDDELSCRIVIIQLELIFVNDERKAELLIESLRKKIARAGLSSSMIVRWRIVSRILSLLARRSFDYRKVLKERSGDFKYLEANGHCNWLPSSLELLPFEHWFKCMAEGRPYTHPPFLKEKRPVDYTRADARVSLR